MELAALPSLPISVRRFRANPQDPRHLAPIPAAILAELRGPQTAIRPVAYYVCMSSVRAWAAGIGPGPLLAALGALAAAITVGVLSANSLVLALSVAVGILLVAIAIKNLAIIPVLAVPATLLQARVGNLLSISDVVLAIAAIVALFMLRGRGAVVLQPLVWAAVFYLSVTIATLILNPYPADFVEWVHELFLIIGSLIVGFVIGRENMAKAALTIYLLACSGIAIAAVLVTAVTFVQTGTIEAAYLPGLQKNTTGGMLAAGAVIAFARPVWLGWSAKWANMVFGLLVIGVVVAQSRQGVIGMVVGVFIVCLRPRPQTGKRPKLIWYGAIPAIYLVLIAVTAQLESSNQFNSANQRVSWYADSVNVWLTSPIFGAGMRWWYSGHFDVNFQPPNAELEVLSTTGVVGTFAFLVLFAVAGWYLYKMDPVYGTVGLAVVATRFTQAQFDLYWVAGQASLLWIVAGICYGVQARDRARAAKEEPPPTMVNGTRALVR
jgi:hypothetical protein